MPSKPNQLIRVGGNTSEKLLSKVHKEFNRLTRKAENLEIDIEEYKQAVDQVQQQVMAELVPLNKTYQQHRAE